MDMCIKLYTANNEFTTVPSYVLFLQINEYVSFISSDNTKKLTSKLTCTLEGYWLRGSKVFENFNYGLVVRKYKILSQCLLSKIQAHICCFTEII